MALVEGTIRDNGGAVYDVRHTDFAGSTPPSDWTLAIQAALDAADAAGGGIVFLPPGTYATTATLTVASGVRLQGAGWVSVISFSPTAADQSAVLLDDVADAAVRSLKVVHSGSYAVERAGHTATYAGGACVEVRNSERCTVHEVYAHGAAIGVWLRNDQGTGGDDPATESWTTNRHHSVVGCMLREQAGYGIQAWHAFACLLAHNDARDCGSDGVKTQARNKHLRIIGNHSQGNGRDGYDFFDGLLESTVQGNVARDNTLYGFEVKGTLGGAVLGEGFDDYVVRDCVFGGNVAVLNGEAGFSVTSVRGVALNGDAAFGNQASGFQFTNVQGVVASGCVAGKNTQQGFLAQQTSRLVLSGCVAADNSYANGTTQNGTYPGFYADETSTVQIVGARAFNGSTTNHKGGQGYGVAFAGGTNSLLTGVDLTGNVTGGLTGVTGNLATTYNSGAGTLVGAAADASDVVFLTPRQKVRTRTLTANSATPSVSDANKAVTANTAATTITSFSNGVDEQVLFFRAGDALTTLQHGTNIILKTGANHIFALNETAMFVREGGVWRQYA
jgi:hypothetical protein